MSSFDETQHARDTAGKFTEMAGGEQLDSLPAAAAATVHLPGVDEIALDLHALEELPPYPASLPPATMTLDDMDIGEHFETTFYLGGEAGAPYEYVFSVWHVGGDWYDTLQGSNEPVPWADDADAEETTEQLLEWAQAAYERADILRDQAHSAVEAQAIRAIQHLAVGGDPVSAPSAHRPQPARLVVDKSRIEHALKVLNSPSRSKNAGDLHEALAAIVSFAEHA